MRNRVRRLKAGVRVRRRHGVRRFFDITNGFDDDEELEVGGGAPDEKQIDEG